ncbi:hypothetical protein IAU60_002956 [Kwoniella sp. DSM 27419]
MAGTIRAIDTDSVHRIHSGQVVLDLQGAIKELVENSLDAGATGIDVRIKDNGLDTIEVSDNGSGIAEPDWESIALKHHTSKLPSLSDLYKVTTFGFRGEALSALCALCQNVTIVTATKETAPMGAILKLGRDGRVLDSTGRIARPRGTTITLEGLFRPLPVRRKEFERTVKRELAKALTLLTAYALVPACGTPDGRQGVRLRVETIGSGKSAKRNTQLSTDGRGSLRASVSAVWGHKALESVDDIELDLEVEIDKVMARREGITERTQTVKVCGLISSSQWGQGRASADRQFYYINGRPCNLSTVARAVNEVYKTFNTHQVPLAILDYQIPPASVDINVSPDKRTIFVHSEDRLIEALKTALDSFFQPSRSTFAVGGATQTVKTIRQVQSQLPRYETMEVKGTSPPDDHERASQERHDQEDSACDDAEDGQRSVHAHAQSAHDTAVNVETVIEIDSEPEEYITSLSRLSGRPRSSQPSQGSRSSRPSSPPASSGRSRKAVQQTIDTRTAAWSPARKSASARPGPGPSSREARASLRRKLEGYASQVGTAVDDASESSEGELAEARTPENEEEEAYVDHVSDGSTGAGEVDIDVVADRVPGEPKSEGREIVEPRGVSASPESAGSDDRSRETASIAHKRPAERRLFEDEDDSSPPVEDGNVSTDVDDEDVQMLPTGTEQSTTLQKSGSYRDEISSTILQGEVTLKFDMNRLRSRYKARNEASKDDRARPRNAFTAVKEAGLADAAGIANKNAALAEEALSRVISKADFERMEVLGQFNRGFIIVRLRSKSKVGGPPTDDLFIVDQHASDEKYNFETLQRTTVIKGQALIKPRPLQLTSGDEIVAMENLDILHRNGFNVEVDEDALPGRGERISLLAMPVSKDTTFDFKDLEQLLHLLGDGSRPQGQMVRCTKARAMFAMRACRKSVMIGKALNKSQMVNLLRNMGTIDQPWNCPHGRPTMRHLSKIEPAAKRSSKRRIDWTRWKAAQEL